MVKRFLTARSGSGGNANRYAPEKDVVPVQFTLKSRKAISADADEVAHNPRARSARLRVAQRTDAPAGGIDAKQISTPQVSGFLQ